MQFTKEQTLELQRRQKQAQREAFYQKARAEFQRQQEIRRQKEAIARAKLKQGTKITWGQKVW
jgi:hypothetical protein